MRQTVALNNSQNFWSTKLSYVPSMMAWIQQHHVSCPQAGITPFWKHDESASTNNEFYGEEAVPSVIGITFNDSPSTNKIYKALSIETPDINEIGGVNTFVPNSGTGNATVKTVVLTALKAKGGILYGGVPGEQRRTVANIQYLGTAIGSEEVVEGFEELGTFTILDGGGDNSWTGQEAVVVNDPANFDEETSPDMVRVFENGFFGEGSPDFAAGTPLFLVYLNSNGDQARGQFADSLITLGSGDFEVFAVSVDYEPTDLDHDR